VRDTEAFGVEDRDFSRGAEEDGAVDPAAETMGSGIGAGAVSPTMSAETGCAALDSVAATIGCFSSLPCVCEGKRNAQMAAPIAIGVPSMNATPTDDTRLVDGAFRSDEVAETGG
jgi:hypothetical protein